MDEHGGQLAGAGPPSQPVLTLCFRLSKQEITVEFLGYTPQPDGTTTLSLRLTNQGRRTVEALGFRSSKWLAVAPGDNTRYRGALGDYAVRWALHNLTPSQEVFRFEPQGAWPQNGAGESFVLTVRGFDPQQLFKAWVRVGSQLVELQDRPSQYNCMTLPPTPSPTPTLTPTATPFVSPLPTPAPDPLLTVHDYVFGEPRILLTNTAELVVTDWLPDNETAIVMPATAPGRGRKQLIQTLHTSDLALRTYGEVPPSYPEIAWLADGQRMAFLKPESGTTALYLSDGNGELPMRIATGNFRGAFAGRGNQVIVVESGATSPRLFDSDGHSLPLPPINLLEYGVNHTNISQSTTIRWHPTEPKVAIFDIGGFVVLDLITGNIQRYELSMLTPMWAPSGVLMARRWLWGL